jgi:hypothetical protein
VAAGTHMHSSNSARTSSTNSSAGRHPCSRLAHSSSARGHSSAQAVLQDIPALEAAAAQPAASLGCCCQSGEPRHMHEQQQQQWACGAAAHRHRWASMDPDIAESEPPQQSCSQTHAVLMSVAVSLR